MATRLPPEGLPLEGLLVLDLTRLLPGAAATQMLQQFGAEVIKVEEPGGGDYARSMPPLRDGEGAVFRAVNRGKKSVVLDLKSREGMLAFRKLASRADVLIEGFRPGVMRRLELDYQTLHATYPGLIYASLTGYGQSGPLAAAAGHDVNYLAIGGLLTPPAIPAGQIGDLAGGAMQAVIGILLALRAREKTGEGQHVDVSMTDGIAWMMALPLAFRAATGSTATMLTGSYACYKLYRVADGTWLAVGALEPKFWREVCEVLDRPDLGADQFAEGARQAELIDEVTRIFSTRTSEEWLERFAGRDCCVTPVLDAEGMLAEPQLRERETIVEMEGAPAPGVIPKLSATPGRIGGPPPRLGQHNGELL